MKLIVGLGNPGPRYRGTRHNVGYRVVEAFAEKHRISMETREKDALTGRGRVAGRSVMLATPQTFMNNSGIAVERLIRAYLESPADMIVVYDDVDLPVGKLRIRERGSAGTHNGMRSILSVLGSDDFPRLRFGIRGESYRPQRDLADYVLEDFTGVEDDLVGSSIEKASNALLMFARDDLRRAMNEFNREQEEISEEIV